MHSRYRAYNRLGAFHLVRSTISIAYYMQKGGGGAQIALLKSCADIASNLLAIDLRLTVRIACDGLQQKCQHAEYFACHPLISQSILI